MRAVVQRTDKASVSVGGVEIAAINHGLTVLLGVCPEDTQQDAAYLAEKIIHLRIFPDEEDKMNLSLKDTGGELLAVSQFTLFGDCRKGRRPSFDKAARPEMAKNLYESFVEYCRQYNIQVSCGQFQAEMEVSLINHGPVTMLLDSKKLF